MTTAAHPSPRGSQASGGRFGEMQVSSYDRVSSLLVALLILVGFAVGLMFMIWLTMIVSFKPRVAAVEPIALKGRGAAAEGFARDLEEPGLEELPDMEPQLSETLEAVTDIVSSQAATLEAMEGNAAESGSGSGMGDSRMAGPGGDGTADAVPEWERLEARLSSRNLKEYVRQLDYFGIELGAMDRDSPRIDYARNFGKGKPDVRNATRDDENRAGRLYFIHEKSVLLQWDTSLLQGAGIKTKGRILAQFYPQALRQDLLSKEQAKLGGRSLAEVKKTIFGVRDSGSGPAFYVVEQTYRRVN